MKVLVLVGLVVLAGGYALVHFAFAPAAPVSSGSDAPSSPESTSVASSPSGSAPVAVAPEGLASSEAPVASPDDPRAASPPAAQDPAAARAQAMAVEKEIMGAHEITDAQALLEKAKIANFQAELPNLGHFTNRTDLLTALNGAHVGGAAVTMPDGAHNWEIQMNLNSSMTDGQLTGTLHLALQQEGKTFSNTDENGNISSVLEYHDQGSAIILRVSPTVYMQLLYVTDSDQFVGNVYSKGPQDQNYLAVGKAWLKRN